MSQPNGSISVIKVGSLSHVGMRRDSNQDAYCTILAPDAPCRADALLAVADGMGGHLAGDVASTMAIEGVLQRLHQKEAAESTHGLDRPWTSVLNEVVQEVNAEVFQAAQQPETAGMGTTLTVALLAGPTLFLAHVGDSRLYLLRNGEFQQLSQDHSWVAEEVARGALTPEEAQSHRRRNLLTRSLGTEPEVQVDTMEVNLQEGDTLLLCSDGLHSLVSDEEIAQMLAREPAQAAAQALVNRANDFGSKDNITVIVARIDSTNERVEAESGPSGQGFASIGKVPGRFFRRLLGQR